MAKAKMIKESRDLYLTRILYDAVEDCNLKQVVTLLTQNKANPNILIPEKKMTPFHLAVGHENLAFGKVATTLILHHGGDPNVRCDGNRTVLHIAVAWNHSLIVDILLKSSHIIPDLYIKDDDNLNVFHYAVKFSAWESLSTLHSYLRHPDYTSNLENLDNQFRRKMQLKDDLIFTNEQKSEKLIVESTLNTSDTLTTNSEHSNSCGSLDSISNSLHNKSISSFSTNLFGDILNKNISSCNSKKLDDMSSNVDFDGSIMSTVSSFDNDFESKENISCATKNLLTNSEVFKFDENEITARNNSCLPKNMYSNINECMTDISILSSYLGSDDYFTCQDSNSEKCILNTSKTDIKLDDVINNISMTSFYDPISRSISNISMESNEVSNISSDESSLTEILDDYDTDYVRQSLRIYGHPPGPLIPSTKRLYVQKLNKLIKEQSKLEHNENHIHISSGSYSSQLNKVLTADEYDTWKLTLKSWKTLENDIVSNKNGVSFTYLLLDPRITKNLPARADEIGKPIEIWQTFISSIFYIGKGTNSRPIDHINEAFNSWIGKNDENNSRKTELILSLWKQKMGVVCVQAFHYLISKEAHIREAAMIDAIGVENLTNEKRGTYHDNTKRWRNSDRCKLGCYLLYRAMLVFLADGERQIFHYCFQN